MNKFPEGLKFFLEPRKKKIKESNARCTKRNVEQENKTPHITPDVLQNSCFYCAKVFINSNYLLKHILRRHSEEVVNFHKKYSQSDPCDLKNLFTYLESEFSELRNEISAVKHAMGLESSKREEGEEPPKRSKEAVCQTTNAAESSGVAMSDTRSNKDQNLENKLNNIEDKVQRLCDKFEENDKNINSKFLLKQDVHQYMTHKEEKILRQQEAQFVEMRQVLLAELKSVLDKRLHENNIEWSAKMTELKTDILKLDQALASIRNQINSPEHLEAVERKLERQIFHFLDNIGQTAMKRKGLKPKGNFTPKIPKTNSSPKIPKTSSLQKIQVLENGSSDSQVSLKRNLLHLNHNEEEQIENSNVAPEMLKDLIAEKLSSFGIFSHTTRLSNSEYEEKLRLVSTNKDYLKMLYHNFSEVYDCVNISADQRVLSILKPKQKRKLRFSEPLILSKDVSPSPLSSAKYFLNKTCPVLKEEMDDFDIHKPTVSPKPAVAVPESKGFIVPDDSGSGDCCDKFQEGYGNRVKKMFDNTEGRRFQTSSPVTEAKGVKKSRNVFSQNSSCEESCEHSVEERRHSAPAKSTSDIILDDDVSLNKTYVKYLNDKNCDKISEIEDEEESLNSLSSLEDDSFANNPIK